MTIHLIVEIRSPVDPGLSEQITRLRNELVARLNALQKGELLIMADLSQIETDVTAQTSVVDSAVTLLGSIAQQLKDAGNDPVKLAALHEHLIANTAALAAAILVNTPAAPVV